MGRQQRQAHDKRVLECLKTVILLAGIDGVKEDRRCRSRAGQLVLNSRVKGVQLGGYRVLSNILVVRRKRIAHQTERTDPDACSDVDITRSGVSSRDLVLGDHK